MANKDQIQRITRYEAMMDRVSASNRALEKALDLFEKTEEMRVELSRYLSSEDWMKDFCDDEEGLLPKDLKRGVLSEDGLYDTLNQRNDLYGRMLGVGKAFFEKK